jgi:hypothetical protein
VDSSFTVSSCPCGQAAGAEDSLIGRLTSKVSPQARQRNSYRGMTREYVMLFDGLPAMRHTRTVVNGEGPSTSDAMPLRRATPEPPGDKPAGDEPAMVPARQRRTLLGRGAHAVRRMTPPHRLAATAVRNTAAWSRRPHGRLAMAGLLIAALVAITGAAGAYLVPRTVSVDSEQLTGQDPLAEHDPDDSPSAVAAAPTSVPSAGPALTPSSDPSLSSSPSAPVGVAGIRPADALNPWAQQMLTRVDIPLTALQAYGYAELVLAQTTPGCQLSWTTLAAIGKVESNHGSSNGAALYPDGQVLPAIVGSALDGKDGRRAVPDSDDGLLDNDRQWDRAVGPMQFIPSTWRTQAVDADNDAIRNPNDIDDAALAAANYLCSSGRDLATPGGWWDAITAYNIPRSYGDKVYKAANEYGTQSRG